MQVRRSILLSSADRFFGTFVKFATLIVTARLLTPTEIGVAVLGMAVLGLASAIREFGGSSYIIQVNDPTPRRVQTVFTIQMMFTLPLAALTALAAEPVARFYDTPGLREFLWVTAACFMFGPFTTPIYALLGRRMAFGALAVLNVVNSSTYGIATVGLVLLGFSYMSFAWATLLAAALTLALSLFWHPKFAIFRATFEDWREVCAFGFADSMRNTMYFLLDNVPLLAFGRTLSAEAVGLYQRAVALAALPTTVLLAGLAPVLLPAFANDARENRALKNSYLNSLGLTTALLWPATIWIIILAKPIVLVLLGDQWLAMVPLVQIIGAAYLIWFPVYVTNPILIAAGGIRDTLTLTLLTIPVMVAIQSVASMWGLQAAVWSLFVTIPWYVFFAVWMVKRRIPFAWGELGAVLGRSATAALLSAIAPLLVVMLLGGPYGVGIAGGVFAGMLGVASWFVALGVTRHPMGDEVRRVFSGLTTRVAALRR